MSIAGDTGYRPFVLRTDASRLKKAHPDAETGFGVRMKSGGPWNLRGLRPEAREAARTAARRSGMSVGEWLNDVIEPEDERDDEEPALVTEFYEEPAAEEPDAEEE